MSTAITSYKDKYERLKGTLTRYREETKEASAQVLFQLEVGAGGAVAALMDAKLRNIPGTDIETKTAVGALLGFAALAGPYLNLGESMSHLANIGAGINAVTIYEQMSGMLASE